MPDGYHKSLPLELTNRMAARYPDCWDLIERMRTEAGVKFDNRCYLPISGYLALTRFYTDDTLNNRLGAVADADNLAAVAPWRIHKQVYQFSQELSELLAEQADSDLTIPVDVLNALPFPCVYIHFPNDPLYDGFFAHFEDDINTNDFELRFLVLPHSLDMTYPLTLHLIPGGTIKQGVDAAISTARNNAPLEISSLLSGEEAKAALNNITLMLQYVLYLCSDNKDVKENIIQKNITRKPKGREYIKDKYREIQIWDCGNEVAEMVRTIRQTSLNPDTNPRTVKKGKGSPKSPHSRRAHWHHYWKGKKGSPDRKPVLRWIAPVFVNCTATEIVQRNIVQ